MGAEWVDFLHAQDARAELRSIAVRDCTPQGRLYPLVVRSDASPASPSERTSSPSESRPLVSVSYQTFSPLDAEAPSHAAAVTARLRGLHFVFLRRFVDEQLALLLTGPVARLLKEKKARELREQRPSPPPPPSLAERRRSSLTSALLPSPSIGRAGEEEAALSPLSSRRLLLVDVALEEVALVVPHHSSSEHCIAASFASIRATNRRVESSCVWR